MTTLFTFLSITLFIAVCSAAVPDGAPAPSPAPAPSSDDATLEFIRTSCGITQYPVLCYRSLAVYATEIQQDPARLASTAIVVSFFKATRMPVYLANIPRSAECGADHRAAIALRDCFSVFGDAVGQIKDSLKQMGSLGLGGPRQDLLFQISNVQTWMSAALTNEDTCTDGFQGVVDCPMKIDVCDRTEKVMQFTSNALALVNSYAAKIQN